HQAHSPNETLHRSTLTSANCTEDFGPRIPVYSVILPDLVPLVLPFWRSISGTIGPLPFRTCYNCVKKAFRHEKQRKVASARTSRAVPPANSHRGWQPAGILISAPDPFQSRRGLLFQMCSAGIATPHTLRPVPGPQPG